MNRSMDSEVDGVPAALESLLPLITAVYEGVLQDPPWQEFLTALREPFQADIAAIFLQPPEPGARVVMLVDGGRPEGIASYKRGQFMLDPFVDLPEGRVVTLHEFITTEALLESDFYRLTMKPSGLYDFLGADLRASGEFEARFRLSRYEGKPRFNEQDKALFGAIAPHLQRAIRIHARLNKLSSERDLYAGAVQQLSLGTILLDGEGRVQQVNPLGEELLAQNDGLSVVGGRLRLGTPEQTAALQVAVDQVLSNQRQAVPSMVEVIRVSRASGRGDLGLVVRAVPRSHFTEGVAVPSVAIFISDPERPGGADAEALQRLFDFTQAEARLALLLADGYSLDEAAAAIGVTRNTVRTHLRSIFSKTGVTRQTLLVRLILNSVAALGQASGAE